MPTDAKAVQTKLKPLRDKLPKTAPQYLQRDYATFTAKADALISALGNAGGDAKAAKDRQDYDKKKKELAELKTKINDAVKQQQGELKSVHDAIPDLNKAASTLINVLKDKKDKAEVDLKNAIMSFAQKAQAETNTIEDAAPLDDD